MVWVVKVSWGIYVRSLIPRWWDAMRGPQVIRVHSWKGAKSEKVVKEFWGGPSHSLCFLVCYVILPCMHSYHLYPWPCKSVGLPAFGFESPKLCFGYFIVIMKRWLLQRHMIVQDILKDPRYKWSPWKCQSKPQWRIASLQLEWLLSKKTKDSRTMKDVEKRKAFSANH